MSCKEFRVVDTTPVLIKYKYGNPPSYTVSVIRGQLWAERQMTLLPQTDPKVSSS